jgi:hypothetical protein
MARRPGKRMYHQPGRNQNMAVQPRFANLFARFKPNHDQGRTKQRKVLFPGKLLHLGHGAAHCRCGLGHSQNLARTPSCPRKEQLDPGANAFAPASFMYATQEAIFCLTQQTQPHALRSSAIISRPIPAIALSGRAFLPADAWSFRIAKTSGRLAYPLRSHFRAARRLRSSPASLPACTFTT